METKEKTGLEIKEKTIVVFHRESNDRYYAHLKSNPDEITGEGISSCEAVGNLITRHMEFLGVKMEIVIDSKVDGNYLVHLKDIPPQKVWGRGRGYDEAVGNLVNFYKEEIHFEDGSILRISYPSKPKEK